VEDEQQIEEAGVPENRFSFALFELQEERDGAETMLNVSIFNFPSSNILIPFPRPA